MISHLILSLAFLVRGTPPPKPLALVFSTMQIPHEEMLKKQGWEVQHLQMPCDNEMNCWANKPGQFAAFRAQVKAVVRGRRNVLLLGVSRGGYLALSLADLPEVSRVAALAPVTEHDKPSVFHGPYAVPLDPKRIAGKRVLLEVGNTDDVVDTQATLRYAVAAMNPKLSVIVTDTSQGHHLFGTEGLSMWLNQEGSK